MGIASIPVRLSIEESSAMALRKVADDLATAGDDHAFLAALDSNQRLWRTLADIAERQHWPDLDRELVDKVMRLSTQVGPNLSGAKVKSLIGINRKVSARLAGGRDDSVGRRAQLAWQETGQPYGLTMDRWLIAEIQRKARYLH